MPIYKTSVKKDGLQQYRVQVSFVDMHGKYRKIERTVYGLAEAKAMEHRLSSEQKNVCSRITLKDLSDEYLAVKSHELRESSFEKERRILENHIFPILGDYRIDKLTTKILQKWKIAIDNKELAITTKKNIYRAFCALLNYAVNMEYISRNLLRQVGNFKDVYFEHEQDKLHYYTPEQFKDYISAARSSARTLNEWGYYVFFNIAFYTGMRKGEINALKWSDISDGVIHIRRSIAQKLKGGYRETPPKNKSSMRDLQIPAPLSIILDEHKERHKLDRRFSESFRVCGGIACLSDTALDNANRKFAALANLPRIRIHDFRHTHASILANEGINIQEIARRLGHSKIETTWNTYSHLYPREEERAIKILNQL